jgi:hypothetical protein
MSDFVGNSTDPGTNFLKSMWAIFKFPILLCHHTSSSSGYKKFLSSDLPLGQGTLLNDENLVQKMTFYREGHICTMGRAFCKIFSQINSLHHSFHLRYQPALYSFQVVGTGKKKMRILEKILQILKKIWYLEHLYIRDIFFYLLHLYIIVCSFISYKIFPKYLDFFMLHGF